MSCKELVSITLCQETQPLRLGIAGLPCEIELFMKPTTISRTYAIQYLDITRSIYHKLKNHNKWIYIINLLTLRREYTINGSGYNHYKRTL